jgi:integrase
MQLIDDPHQGKLVPVTLDKAVKEFYTWCRTVRNNATRTLANHKQVLDILLTVCDPQMPAHQLNSTHISWALERAKAGESPSETVARQIKNPNAKARTPRQGRTLNKDKATYNQFIRFCHTALYLSRFNNPMEGVRYTNNKIRVLDRPQYVVPPSEWAALLKLARDRHPRDEMLVAMGLYGGRRWSDIDDMRIGDIDLNNPTGPTFTFRNSKGGGREVTLPILWPEFVDVFRRYFSWYAAECRMGWDKNWYLIPRRVGTREMRTGREAPTMDPSWPIDPERPCPRGMARRDVQAALEIIGAPMDGAGPHMLRHSCADWLLHTLKWDLYHVKEYLDHESVLTTQTYVDHGQTVRLLRERYGDPSNQHDPAPVKLATVIQFKRQLADEDDVA